MKILFCSPEVYPFSKAGGVADFSASLPKALNKLNTVVNVVTPYHQVVKDEYSSEMQFVGSKTIVLDNMEEIANYYKTSRDGVNYYFIEHSFFNRVKFFDHDDDIKRFMFFNLAILELIDLIKYYPDIIHLNDWTNALLPYFLDSFYKEKLGYENIKTLLTIHNLEKQGAYPKTYEHLFTKKNFTYLHIDNINFLKTGIMRSSKINTVSHSYRSEMLTKFFGFSLDGALKSRQLDLRGIQNGLDFELYNPELDPYIFKNYNIDNFTKGKKINKENLYEELGFKDSNKMLVSYIGKFGKQKGIDLITSVIDKYLINDEFYFVVNGQGDYQYETYFSELALKYPDNFRYFEGFKHKLSQKIYASSDLLLMPSLYEASGLNQMIAMRYGTIPLVRETGGLKDTVTSYDKATNTGTGFTFENFDAKEFSEAIDLAVYYYNNEKEHFNNIISNGMKIDNDILSMAKEYHNLYFEILK